MARSNNSDKSNRAKELTPKAQANSKANTKTNRADPNGTVGQQTGPEALRPLHPLDADRLDACTKSMRLHGKLFASASLARQWTNAAANKKATPPSPKRKAS